MVWTDKVVQIVWRIRMKFSELLPPYLDQGSKGPAVNLVGALMRWAGYDPESTIILDGEYTRFGAIAAAVCAFQMKQNLEVDGNFGPATRAAFFGELINATPTACDLFPSDFLGETQWVGPGGQSGVFTSGQNIIE